MQFINTETQLCAVIGNPVKHSLSPAMHNAAFQHCRLNYVYLAFEICEVRDFLQGMRSMPNFRGVSVTIPHKLTVMDALDEIDSLALQIGSVNTILQQGGRLIGSNTDGSGTLRAFDEAGISLEGKKIVFLGGGGAVRAVSFAMATRKPAAITLLGRTPEKLFGLADDLRKHHPVPVETGNLTADLETFVGPADIVINGTPLGMYPDQVALTPAPGVLLQTHQVVFDMVYRPQHTRLLQEAEAKGCTTLYGLEMLLNQASLQFETWTGESAPVSVMRDALLAALEP